TKIARASSDKPTTSRSIARGMSWTNGSSIGGTTSLTAPAVHRHTRVVHLTRVGGCGAGHAVGVDAELSPCGAPTPKNFEDGAPCVRRRIGHVARQAHLHLHELLEQSCVLVAQITARRPSPRLPSGDTHATNTELFGEFALGPAGCNANRASDDGWRQR